jgi:hypothetical protein
MVCFDVLARSFLGCEELVHGAGALIVEYVERRLVSDGSKLAVDAGECSDHTAVFSRLHWS